MGSLTFISKHSLAGTPQPETVRAPEIEKGVGCDLDSYLLVPDSSLDDRIAAAKARLGKDAVILGHHQRDEVVKFADLRGDALKHATTPAVGLENLGAGKIVNQISVVEQTRHYAKAALDRMLSLHER